MCQHGRRRTQCKECGGSQICQHGRRRDRCKECGGSQICKHGRRRGHCKECGDYRCSQCNRAFSSAQALKKHVDREVCSREQGGRWGRSATKRKRTAAGGEPPLQGPKHPRNAEECRDEDDDIIPPTPWLILGDSVTLMVDDEATESDSHQPEQEVALEPGPSRSVVEEFVIFESCGPAMEDEKGCTEVIEKANEVLAMQLQRELSGLRPLRASCGTR